MIKAIGSIFIIFSSTCIGYILGTSFENRVRELKLLKMSLQMLETEISYSNTPLPIAFHNVAAKSRSPIKEFFSEVSSNLKSRTYSTVGDAFEKALDSCKESMSLAKDDVEILKSFGYSMGTSDTEGQIKSFKLVLKQLESQEIKAEDLRKKNEKLYNNLGLLGGIAVTILLM